MFFLVAQRVDELEESLKKKDEEMKQMEERYKKYLEKAKSVSGTSILKYFCKLYLIVNKHVWCKSFFAGYSDSGPKAEPGLRSRSPSSEKPATGEGKNAAFAGGKTKTQ